MRLGDLDALFYKLVNTDPNTHGRFCDGVAKALEFILNAPTIDAVQVCRCKDCKHHQIMENKKSFMYWHNCKLWCADISEDDFCSYGERRGDGNAD